MTVLAVFLIVGCLFAISKAFGPKSDGTIEVTVVNLEGETVADKKIEFKKGDEITTLLENNFDNGVIEDGFLYSIDTLTTPEDWSTFICLYVDGEMSRVGILEVEFTDGTVISFVDTEMSY